MSDTDPTAAALDALAESELRNRAALRRLADHQAATIPAGWTLWADEAPTARLVEWRYLHRREVHRGQPGNFENTEGVLWQPLPDTPGQAEAQGRAETEMHAKYAAGPVRDAAPELLAALKNLVANVLEYPAWERPCHAVDVAEIVIARAEGRT